MEFDMSKLRAEHILILLALKYLLDWALSIFKKAKAEPKDVNKTLEAADLYDDLKLLSSNVSDITKIIVDIRLEQSATKEKLVHIQGDILELKGVAREKPCASKLN
jgi:hypothetical protein